MLKIRNVTLVSMGFEWMNILPSLFYEIKFITNFKKKVELFNTFFTNQCTLLINSSVLPNNLAKPSNKSIDTVSFSTDDISKIIKNLDTNKAHSHDMFSIWLIKLCENLICNPLSIIFNDCRKERKFASDWKKAHAVPVHKKGDKQCLKNYRTTALLPICSKIFERLIYNDLFTLFTDNNLTSPNRPFSFF